MTVAELVRRLMVCDPESVVGVMVDGDILIPAHVCEDEGHVTIEIEEEVPS